MKTFHLGIYGIIIKDRAMLLVRKTRGPYTGLLDLPGGSPEHGETIVQTLAREIEEETGVIVRTSSLFDNISTKINYTKETPVTLHHTGLLYLIDDYDDSTLRYEGIHEDTCEALWYDIHDAKREELSPFAQHVTETLRKNPFLW